jgi:hypothetical protein
VSVTMNSCSSPPIRNVIGFLFLHFFTPIFFETVCFQCYFEVIFLMSVAYIGGNNKVGSEHIV